MSTARWAAEEGTIWLAHKAASGKVCSILNRSDGSVASQLTASGTAATSVAVDDGRKSAVALENEVGITEYVDFYDSSFNQQWRSGGWNIINKVAVDSSGNVVAGGGGDNAADHEVVYYDSTGAKVWGYDWGGSGANVNDVAFDSAGKVYVSGDRASSRAFVRFDAAGAVELTIDTDDGTGTNPGFAEVAVDDTGNIYLSGQWGNGGSNYYALRKYNSAGVQQWEFEKGAGAHQWTHIAVDDSGNVYVTGVRYNNLTTFKLNSSGVEQWSYDHGATTLCVAVERNTGDVYVSGVYSGPSINLRRLNSAGSAQWSVAVGTGNGFGVAVLPGLHPVFW